MRKLLKASLLAGAVALGLAGHASAALQDTSSGNSALVLSVWDPSTGVSYTRGLGMNLNDFLPGTTTFAPIAPDALFTSLFGSNITSSSLLWNIAAGDSTSTTGERFAVTSTTATAAPLIGAPYNASTNLTTYLGQVNQAAGCTLGSNSGSCGSTSATDAWSVLNTNSTKWGTNAGNALNFTDAGGVGQSLYFLLASAPGGTTGGRGTATVDYYGDAPLLLTLSANGTLSEAATVPEPRAVWLLAAGLLAVGGIVARRRG